MAASAPPPHPWTKRHTRLAIALGLIAAAIGAFNYFKSTAGNSGVQNIGGVGPQTNNGIQGNSNSGSIYNAPVYNNSQSPQPSGPQQRSFENGAGIPFDETAVKGVLKPSNEPTPTNACSRFPIPSDAVTVLVGTNAVMGRGSFTVIKIKQCPVLFIKDGPDGILISASLYDPDSNAVVSVKENKVEALDGERYRARQSRDEGSLTVKNMAGSELFYIRYLNRSTVRFRGFLGCAGGPMVHVQEGQPIAGVIFENNCAAFGATAFQIGPP